MEQSLKELLDNGKVEAIRKYVSDLIASNSSLDKLLELTSQDISSYLSEIHFNEVMNSPKKITREKGKTMSLILSEITATPMTENDVRKMLMSKGFTNGGAKSAAGYHIKRLSGEKFNSIVPTRNTSPIVWRVR